jgi:RNA polymerase sigma-70 factor (ECF subfamily)
VTSPLDQAFAEEWPRVVGATLRSFGSIDLAEEAAQEAFVRAAELMARGEQIANVGAWATIAARRIAIDALRRERALVDKLPLLLDDPAVDDVDVADDRLGLIFVACDPALSIEQQVAMALRIVCGVSTVDIADFFGVPEPTMAARLTRAKKAIARSGGRFIWPDHAQRSSRLDATLTTIYGVYTLGHTAVRGDELTDAALGGLALALIQAVVGDFPDDTEALGLLALIMLGEARRPARATPDGMPLTLAEVDRSAWGRRRISNGLDLAARALPGGGRFALQAGIAGLHSSAARWEDTDWPAIVTLYHGLIRQWPAPIVRLGMIVAQSHLGAVERERAAHELLAMAEGDHDRRVDAALADLEERRGDIPAALAALDRARLGETNEAILRYYGRVRARLMGKSAQTT